MQFHYDRTLKQKVKAATQTANASPAGLTIYLAKSLKEWLGQSCRVSYQDGKTQLQLGYETLSVPALEFAQAFAPLVCGVNPLWPVQIFGMADNGELIELSFTEKSGEYIVQQHNISGIWCENLQDIYVCIQFPDPLSTGCMYQLLWAAVHDAFVIALDWRFADCLERQQMFTPDRTLSYCYVPLNSSPAQNDPVACLSGLSLPQKKPFGAFLWKSIGFRLNLNGSGMPCCKTACQTGSSGIWRFTTHWNHWASGSSATEASSSLWTAQGSACILAWIIPTP